MDRRYRRLAADGIYSLKVRDESWGGRGVYIGLEGSVMEIDMEGKRRDVDMAIMGYRHYGKNSRQLKNVVDLV